MSKKVRNLIIGLVILVVLGGVLALLMLTQGDGQGDDVSSEPPYAVDSIKLVDKKPMPAYMLYAGGCDAQGAEQFGQELGMMLEQDIPAFLAELGRAVRASDGTFAQWYPAHEAEFKEIAERYIAD